MEKHSLSFLKSCVVIIILFIIFSGCVTTITPADDPVLPSRGFYMGILPNPTEGQDFEEIYAMAANHAEFVPVWSVGAGADGFWNYADRLEGFWGSIFLEGYIRANSMVPLIHFSFIDKDGTNLILKTPSHLPDATLNDTTWRELYKESVLSVVRTARPLYLSLRNEVNRWYEQYGVETENPNGFQHYISLYEEIYDAVKQLSPKTIVFCVFSREIVSENREADLSVLSLFDPEKLDLLLFTTYPYSVAGINRPSDIPDDYYSKAFQYIPQKAFGFSEIGWSTLDAFGGELAQYQFLMNLSTSLTVEQDLDLHLFSYCWLHDLEGGDTTGLIHRNGTEKLGYLAWKQLSNASLWK